MSTRGRIAFQISKNEIVSIYVHFDAYPAGVGKTLLEHWNTPERVNALMALGDLSSLGSELGDKHDFAKHDHRSSSCLAYGRDRGEQNVSSVVCKTRAELVELAKECWGEFVYVFDGTSWSYTPVNGSKRTNFRKLTQKACQKD